jgi:hypothetical protein
VAAPPRFSGNRLLWSPIAADAGQQWTVYPPNGYYFREMWVMLYKLDGSTLECRVTRTVAWVRQARPRLS